MNFAKGAYGNVTEELLFRLFLICSLCLAG